MARYLDFEKEEKGFEIFQLTPENIKGNIGRHICWVDKCRIDKYRGNYTVEHGVIFGKHYSQLILDDGNNNVDIRDIVECGIKIVPENEE